MEEFGRVSGLAIRRFAGFTIATGVIFGFLNAVKQATNEAISFEREIVRLSQVNKSGVLALRGLSAEVTSLATAFGVSSASLLQSSRTLRQAGFSVNDARQALEGLAKTDLAPTFDNLTTTTEGAIAVVRQFNLEINDLESVLGSVNAVAGQFAVESSDIIAAVRRSGGVFAAAAGNPADGKRAVNEFIALFTSVRSTTRETAESIATGLRTIFSRIQRRGTIDGLRQLGVELLDAEQKFVGPFKAVQRLNEELKILSSNDPRFSSIVEELGGIRQIGKIIPLIQRFDSVAEKAFKVAQEGANSLDEDATKALGSLSVQIDRTRESFLALIRSVTEGGTFKFLASSILSTTNAAISLADAFSPLLPILTAFAGIKLAQTGIQFSRGFRQGIGANGKNPATSSTAALNANTSSQNKATLAEEKNTAAQKTNTSSNSASTKQLSASVIALDSATDRNTIAIDRLTTAVGTLRVTIGARSIGGISPRTRNSGGPIKKFATGGVVPGSGNGDTVDIKATPGEFVFSKPAVENIGLNNISKLHKFARGGSSTFTPSLSGRGVAQGNVGRRKQFLAQKLQFLTDRAKAGQISSSEEQELISLVSRLRHIKEDRTQRFANRFGFAIGGNKGKRKNLGRTTNRIFDLLSHSGKTSLNSLYDTRKSYDSYPNINIVQKKLPKSRDTYRNQAVGVWEEASRTFSEQGLGAANSLIRSNTKGFSPPLNPSELNPENSDSLRINKITGGLAEKDLEMVGRKLGTRSGVDFLVGKNHFAEVKTVNRNINPKELKAKTMLAYAVEQEKKSFKNAKDDQLFSRDPITLDYYSDFGLTNQRKARGGPVKMAIGGALSIEEIRKRLRKEATEGPGVKPFLGSNTITRSRKGDGGPQIIGSISNKGESSGNTYGGIFLRPGDVDSKVFGSISGEEISRKIGDRRRRNNIPFDLSLVSLPEQSSNLLEDIILGNVVGGIQDGASQVARKAGFKSGPQIDNEFLKKFSIDNIVGNIFEAILLAGGAPFDSGIKEFQGNKTFDFPAGIGGLSNLFKSKELANTNTPVDAKSSFNQEQIRSLIDKIRDSEFDAIKKGKSIDPLDGSSAVSSVSATGRLRLSSLSKATGGKRAISTIKKASLADENPRNAELPALRQSVPGFKAFEKDLKRANPEISPDDIKRRTGPWIRDNFEFDAAFGGEAPGSINALLTPGELVFNPIAAQKASISGLHKFNKSGDPSALRGFDSRNVAMVPGSGNTDSFSTALPEGSFVIRKSSSQNVGGSFKGLRKQRFNSGGPVGFASGGPVRFQNGGPGDPTGRTIKLDSVDSFLKALEKVGRNLEDLNPNVREFKSAIKEAERGLAQNKTVEEVTSKARKNIEASTDRVLERATRGDIAETTPIKLGRTPSEIARDKISARDIIKLRKQEIKQLETNQREVNRKRRDEFGDDFDIAQSQSRGPIGRTKALENELNRLQKKYARQGKVVDGVTASTKRYEKAIAAGATAEQALTKERKFLERREAARSRQSTPLTRTGRQAKSSLLDNGRGQTLAFLAIPTIQAAFEQSGADTPQGAGISAALGGAFAGGTTGSLLGGGPFTIAGGALVGAVVGYTSAVEKATNDLLQNQLAKEVEKFSKALSEFSDGKLDEQQLDKVAISAAKKAFEIGSREFTDRGIKASLVGALLPDDNIGRAIKSLVTQKGVIGALNSDPEALIKEQRDEAQRIKDAFSEGSQIVGSTIESKIKLGKFGFDDLTGLGLEQLVSLGTQDVSRTLEIGAFADPAERLRLFAEEGLKVAISTTKQGLEQEKLRLKLESVSGLVNLLGVRLTKLSDVFRLVADSTQNLQNNIDSISNGFGSLEKFDFKGVQNIEFDSDERFNSALKTFSAFGGDGANELNKILQDVRTLSASSLSIVADIAGGTGIRGVPQEKIFDKLTGDSGILKGLTPIVAKAFEAEIDKLFNESRQGPAGNPVDVIEKDFGQVIENVNTIFSEPARAAGVELTNTINTISNQFLNNAQLFSKSVLEASEIQFKTNDLISQRRAKLRSLRGGEDSFAEALAQSNRQVSTRTGGILDPKAISNAIFASRKEEEAIKLRSTAALLANDENAFVETVRELANNTEQGQNLEKALELLATDVSALTIVEKKLADLQSRKDQGRGILARFAEASLDPKAALELNKDIFSLLALKTGQISTAEQLKRGSAFALQLAENRGPEEVKRTKELIDTREAQIIGFRGRAGIQGANAFKSQLVDKPGEEQVLVKQFDEVTQRQVAALKEQVELTKVTGESILVSAKQIFEAQAANIKAGVDAVGTKFPNAIAEAASAAALASSALIDKKLEKLAGLSKEDIQNIFKGIPVPDLGGEITDPIVDQLELIEESIKALLPKPKKLSPDLDRRSFFDITNSPNKFAHGGFIKGAYKGHGIDSVPAILQPGEFVLKRSVAQNPNVKPFLPGLNSGTPAVSPTGFANGGFVDKGEVSSKYSSLLEEFIKQRIKENIKERINPLTSRSIADKGIRGSEIFNKGYDFINGLLSLTGKKIDPIVRIVGKDFDDFTKSSNDATRDGKAFFQLLGNKSLDIVTHPIGGYEDLRLDKVYREALEGIEGTALTSGSSDGTLRKADVALGNLFGGTDLSKGLIGGKEKPSAITGRPVERGLVQRILSVDFEKKERAFKEKEVKEFREWLFEVYKKNLAQQAGLKEERAVLRRKADSEFLRSTPAGFVSSGNTLKDLLTGRDGARKPSRKPPGEAFPRRLTRENIANNIDFKRDQFENIASGKFISSNTRSRTQEESLDRLRKQREAINNTDDAGSREDFLASLERSNQTNRAAKGFVNRAREIREAEEEFGGQGINRKAVEAAINKKQAESKFPFIRGGTNREFRIGFNPLRQRQQDRAVKRLEAAFGEGAADPKNNIAGFRAGRLRTNLADRTRQEELLKKRPSLGVTQRRELFDVLGAKTREDKASAFKRYIDSGLFINEFLKRAELERKRRKGEFIGPLLPFADGGSVDSVLGKLQPGEFVVNRGAAQANMEMLKRLNAGHQIPGFADGGLVTDNRGNSSRSSSGSRFNTKLPNVVSKDAIFAMNSLARGMGGLTDSINKLGDLERISTELNKVAEKLSSLNGEFRITVQSAPIQVNVVMNGAEVFKDMEESFGKLAAGKISDALNKSVNKITGETFPILA